MRYVCINFLCRFSARNCKIISKIDRHHLCLGTNPHTKNKKHLSNIVACIVSTRWCATISGKSHCLSWLKIIRSTPKSIGIILAMVLTHNPKIKNIHKKIVVCRASTRLCTAISAISLYRAIYFG